MRESNASESGQRELSLAVVGLQFANTDKSKSSRRFEALLCKPGEPVELRPEPKNPADTRAIAVFSARGVQLGYLTAERAPWIGGKLGAGEEAAAIFQGLGNGIAIIRLRFGGDAPTLPPERPAGGDTANRTPIDDEFYPDPEGPEWGA